MQAVLFFKYEIAVWICTRTKRKLTKTQASSPLRRMPNQLFRTYNSFRRNYNFIPQLSIWVNDYHYREFTRSFAAPTQRRQGGVMNNFRGSVRPMQKKPNI
jgi:hypothetical protein